jgi:hypothetical protein
VAKIGWLRPRHVLQLSCKAQPRQPTENDTHLAVSPPRPRKRAGAQCAGVVDAVTNGARCSCGAMHDGMRQVSVSWRPRQDPTQPFTPAPCPSSDRSAPAQFPRRGSHARIDGVMNRYPFACVWLVAQARKGSFFIIGR